MPRHALLFEDVGLRLDEAKAMLYSFARGSDPPATTDGYLNAQRPCPSCHRLRAINTNEFIVCRGRLDLASVEKGAAELLLGRAANV